VIDGEKEAPLTVKLFGTVGFGNTKNKAVLGPRFVFFAISDQRSEVIRIRRELTRIFAAKMSAEETIWHLNLALAFNWVNRFLLQC
jgi:hypothetical protein